MRRLIILIITSLFLLPIFSNLLPSTPVQHEITKFIDDTAEKTVNFNSGGFPDQPTAIEIPKKAVVTDASFNISTVYNQPNYPLAPRIDVGGDGDYEWAYSGNGYGEYGRQNVFSNGLDTYMKNFEGNVTYDDKMKILLPKNATINHASMSVNGENIKNITIDQSVTWNWVYPFYGSSPSQLKFQTLYKRYDIDFKGLISKIYFKSSTTQSGATFNSFTVKFYNTSVSSLSSTFANNYGSNKPVTVFSKSLTLNTVSGQWIEIDVDDKFYYNNTQNLLIELTWNGDNGRNVYTEYYSPYNYTHTVYSTSLSATTGSTTTLGHDLMLGFNIGGPKNVTVDIGNNGTLEFNNTGNFTGLKFIPDFTTELSNLTNDLPVSFIDGYGNQFVEIPINLTNDGNGIIYLENLDIRYNLTSKVFLNPHNGNLTNEFNELVPPVGEGNMTIPIILRTSSMGKLKIGDISIKYFVPELTNDKLLLLNGHGPTNICYADFENYLFMVNVTNKEGTNDISDVILILDSIGEEIKLRWNRSSNNFDELSDPKNFVELDLGNCTSNVIETNRWNLYYSVRFTWAYPNERLEVCAINTTNSSGSWVFNRFENVYMVENDLELIGTLEVVAKDQGKLENDGKHNWVHASEKITWSNLTAVYEGTVDFYPENKNFDITIEDNDGDKWINTSSSGKPFMITTTADPTSDYNNIHYINITNIPGIGQDVSFWSFNIRIDNDGPLAPATIICRADTPNDPETQADDDTTIYVNWSNADDQGGSGIKYYTMEYNNPLPIKIRQSGASAIGEEGVAKFYVRARDRVGNWGISGSDSIIIDLTDLSFSDPVPSPLLWHNSMTVDCGVTIKDIGGSGVLGSDIQYRYVESGSIEGGAWHAYPSQQNSETIYCTQEITFKKDGTEKKIQWRAQDLAGNGFINSDIYTLKIDSTNVTFGGFNINFNKWYNFQTPTIEFYINDTNPFGGESSGVNINSIYYSISTTGNDSNSYGDWFQLEPTGSGSSVKCSVTPMFANGFQNYIRFKANDIAGNEFISDNYNIKIDMTPPIFSNPVPGFDKWNNDIELQCNITIFDDWSKVNAKSVRYSISTNGTKQYSNWRLINLKHLSKFMHKRITLSCNETFKEGQNNYIRWQAEDSAGNSIISQDYRIIIDTIECTFHEPTPMPDEWFNTLSIACSIRINDTYGSGVDTQSIEYAKSLKGPDNIINWESEDIELTELEGINSVKVEVTIDGFNTGRENYIYWRVKDLAGNGYKTSGPHKILIDMAPIVFSNPKPVDQSWEIDLEIPCRITIIDKGGSDVDLDSIEFRYSTTGKQRYSDWTSEGVSANKKGNGYELLVYVTFAFGYDNFIQWHGKDNAGNGPFTSNETNIFINSPPIIKISNPRKTGYYEEDKRIIFDARNSEDPDFGDVLSFYWEAISKDSNTSTSIGFKDYFKTILLPAEYKIVLYLADNFGHNESAYVDITVNWFDLDGDKIPDIYDDDDDGDKYPDNEDAFPRNVNYYLDTDFDNIPDKIDPDDDNDNVPDEEDKYPKDKDRFKDEVSDSSSMQFLMIGIVVTVIILLLVAVTFLKRRSAKKKEGKEKVEEPDKEKVKQKEPIAGPMPTPMPMPMPIGFQQTAPIPTLPPMQPVSPMSMPPPQVPVPTPFYPPQSVYMPGQLPILPPMMLPFPGPPQGMQTTYPSTPAQPTPIQPSPKPTQPVSKPPTQVPNGQPQVMQQPPSQPVKRKLEE